uniref:Uncharacterized protein n=1 Tax=Anguilla anguilla TaxID=7936 RepID=A0A0E9RZ11_ANGAN
MCAVHNETNIPLIVLLI